MMYFSYDQLVMILGVALVITLIFGIPFVYLISGKMRL
jgi:hypothetical protein